MLSPSFTQSLRFSVTVLCGLFIANCVSAQTTTTDTENSPLLQQTLSIAAKVDKEKRYTTSYDPNELAALPLGIIKEIGVTKYVICIDNAVFKPTDAYFDAYMALEFPGTEKKLAFAAKNVAFNPKGISAGSNMRLELVSTHRIQVNSKVTLILPGDGVNYVNWDCNGFKSVHLKGYFEFDPSMIYPDPDSTKDDKVRANFEVDLTDMHDFIARISITPFCIKGLKNIAFSVTDATVDYSELHNTGDMTFPVGYTAPDAEDGNTWRGFYMKEFKVKLPTELSNGNKRMEIVATNFVIDSKGVSGFFQVNNLFKIEEGSMNGWPFSIDMLGVNIVHNRLNGGSVEGKLQLPMMHDNGLKYAASIFQNDAIEETDYIFVFSPQKSIVVPCFAAKMELYPTSAITVIKKNGKFKGEADLNGNLSVEHRNLNVGALTFEHVLLSTDKPYIKGGIFNYAAADTTKANNRVAGFPISIDNITIALNPMAPTLLFDLRVSFMNKEDAGFSAQTRVAIITAIREVEATDKITETGNDVPDAPETGTNGQNATSKDPKKNYRTKWLFDRVAITDIYLAVQTKPFEMTGHIKFKENDPVYGKGFFGKLDFKLKTGMDNPIGMGVSTWFGKKDDFRYWYVDGTLTYTIPICSGLSIYRLMGGLYYHMRVPDNGAGMVNNLQTPAFGTAANYIPDKATGIGFKAGVTLGTSGNSKPFNGDVAIEVAFTDHGGLKFIQLNGDIFFMTTVADRIGKTPADLPVTAIMRMEYDALNHSFHAVLDAKVNYNIVNGSGQCVVHFDPAVWYICAGRPSNRFTVEIASLATLQAYFMIGTQVEPMPPLTGLLAGLGEVQNRDESKLKNATGFVTGADLSSNGSYEAKLLKFGLAVSYWAQLGFDLMLLDYGPQAHCSASGQPAGFKGWYANGRIYGGIAANLAVIAGKRRISIMDGSVRTLLSGGVPDPSYFHGLINVDYSFHVGISFKGSYEMNIKLGDECLVN